MILPVILSPAAERELNDAADWYERERGSGANFFARVEESLGRIGEEPERHPVVHEQIRRVRVPRFSYNVFYRVLPDRVEVIAIVHAHRDPALWKNRS